ncbi:hypothetical protein C8Q73DRAFT_29866 [Cubamyces lactineus]|nr:hypothetical protein C8Q73DRAFT_29866 [Cubamyces lactineus]
MGLPRHPLLDTPYPRSTQSAIGIEPCSPGPRAPCCAREHSRSLLASSQARCGYTACAERVLTNAPYRAPSISRVRRCTCHSRAGGAVPPAVLNEECDGGTGQHQPTPPAHRPIPNDLLPRPSSGPQTVSTISAMPEAISERSLAQHRSTRRYADPWPIVRSRSSSSRRRYEGGDWLALFMPPS